MAESAHRFMPDPKLCERIEQRVRQRQEQLQQLDPAEHDEIVMRNLPHIVESNDQVVSDGAFDTPEGRQELPAAQPTERVRAADVVAPLVEQRFPVTELCVVNADTITAALEVGNACALNFANESRPGGLYRTGGTAQEEDLCRQVPQLYASLAASEYPIPPGTALLSKGLAVVRRSGTYELCPSLGEVNIITAAMPCWEPKPGSPEWIETVNLRIRSVLEAGKHSGLPNLVLGAFGCGMFGNPPDKVAEIFKEQLSSAEFRGAFSKVVFAIIGPERNRDDFVKVLGTLA